LYNKITYLWNIESHKQFAYRCVPWKVIILWENLILHVLQFQNVGVCRELPGWVDIRYYRFNECFMED